MYNLICDLLLKCVGAERNVLSGAGEIFLRKVLQVDTYSKKGDPTEPKTLVCLYM